MWYDDLDLQIPEDMDFVKTEILEKLQLVKKRTDIMVRLKNAREFFSNKTLSQDVTVKGIDLLEELVSDLISLDVEIANKDINIMSIIESRYLNLGNAILKTNDVINELGQKIVGKDVNVSLDTSSNLKSISPEEIWLIKTTKRIFGIEDNNIEIK